MDDFTVSELPRQVNNRRGLECGRVRLLTHAFHHRTRNDGVEG